MGASLSNKTNCPNANELFTISQENSRRDSQSLPDTVKFKLKFRKNKFGSSCKLVKDNGANSSRTQNNSLCSKVKVISLKIAKEKQSPRKVSRRTVFKAKKKSDFRKKLDRMTKEQLVNFMMHIAEMNVGVEQELERISPTPDLLSYQTQLEASLNEIYQAFPSDYVGSLRNSFCFKKVHTQVVAFERQCIDQINSLVQASLWSLTIEYIFMAWPILERLPDWNEASHNSHKQAIFDNFASQMLKSVRKQNFTQEDYASLKLRLEKVKYINSSILYVLQEVNEQIGNSQKYGDSIVHVF